MSIIPAQARSKTLRACLLCSIIQLPKDFQRGGCPNCEEILQVCACSVFRCCSPQLIVTRATRSQMKGSPDRIQTCTTTQFDGVISVIDPDSSWVARWQRTGAFISRYTLARLFELTLCITAKYVRGMYAVRVTGRIPEDVEMELERRNIKYRPRDQSDQD